MFEKMKKSLATGLIDFLSLYPANKQNFSIQEYINFDGNVSVNKIWYRGESYELSQLYKQINNNSFSFWGSVPTSGMEIRKIHTGLPSTIVDTLTSLTIADLQDVNIANAKYDKIWNDMMKTKKTDFHDTIECAISDTLVTGDGAFKISFDNSISEYPILEFYEADRIDIVSKNKETIEIVFKTTYNSGGFRYILKEHYGKGYIKNELIDEHGHDVPLSRLKETESLQDVEWNEKIILASYLKFFNSNKYKGRGKSIYDAKKDNFDALDEAWSQWMDALRAGRTKTYIPRDLIPVNPKTLQPQRSNAFDNRFIAIENSMQENTKGQIITVSPEIPHDSYLSTYITALDLCLQGIISPSTLGIDTKKLENAEAQREKEKTTLYTRQAIINGLQKTLSDIIYKLLFAYMTIKGNIITDEVKIDVPFGEYANPSFESQVETIAKAKQSGIMSIRAGIDELYGDTRDDKWKEDELKRIYKEQGILDNDSDTDKV